MAIPPSTVRNLQLWKKHCRKVRALAQRIIENKVGIIEGSRQMLVYEQWLHAWEETDFGVFRAICSESNHLPIGKVREHWSLSALKKKDKETARIEDHYRDWIIEASKQIQKKYL